MIIAIPTKNGNVDNHFGHCTYYTFYTVDENKNIVDEKRFEAPSGCGCKSGVATTLKELGIKLMLAGNMGDGALNVLAQNDIQVIRGCSGEVKEVALAYLRGELEDTGVGCASHGSDHVCSHDHEHE